MGDRHKAQQAHAKQQVTKGLEGPATDQVNSMSDEKDNPGYITSELCEAYRETLQVEIKAMEKSIKLTVAVVGVLIAVIQIIINFLL